MDFQKISRMQDTVFRYFLRRRYKITEIEKKGDSIYEAIALGVCGNANQASTVRADVKRHIMGRLDLYRPFFVHNAGTNVDNVMLCKVNLISCEGEPGGQESLAAACRIYGVTIIVEDLSGRRIIIKKKGDDGSASSRVIYMSCHTDNYFNVLTPLVTTTTKGTEIPNEYNNLDLQENSEIFELMDDGRHEYSSLVRVGEARAQNLGLPTTQGESYPLRRAVFPCGMCKLISLSPLAMKDHVIKEHGNTPATVIQSNHDDCRLADIDTPLFRCYICLSSFYAAFFACMHIRVCKVVAEEKYDTEST